MKIQILRSSIVKTFIFTVLFAVPALAQETLSGGYSFGPGTANAVRGDVRINLPARSNVTFLVLLQRNLTDATGRRLPLDVPVVVEVLRPDQSIAVSQAASATVISAGLPIPVVPIVGTFTSQLGCPGSWTVRVRTPNNLAPPVRIFGTVTFGFIRPGKVDLDMEGDAELNAGTSLTRTLSGHQLIGGSDRSLIAGMGTFRVRAKWHTDPLDLNPLHFGKYFRTRVELLRPNNTVAAFEEGFSQHAPTGNTPRVDFTYAMTAADTQLTGAWKVRINNLAGNPRIVGFDIEKGLVDPLAPTLESFNSTFTPQCTPATTVR
ncbi:MAG: hypothetical protein ACJ72Z_01780 [Pyrinomonadaceae bacterium]